MNKVIVFLDQVCRLWKEKLGEGAVQVSENIFYNFWIYLFIYTLSGIGNSPGCERHLKENVIEKAHHIALYLLHTLPRT